MSFSQTLLSLGLPKDASVPALFTDTTIFHAKLMAKSNDLIAEEFGLHRDFSDNHSARPDACNITRVLSKS